MTPSRPLTAFWSTIPSRHRRSLCAIGLGWALSALCVAGATTALALALMRTVEPWTVALSAALAAAVTIVVSRAGYLAGARLAGSLYGVIGDAFTTARLSWFSESNRQLTSAVAGRGIPQLMGLPAHQLQSFLVAPLLPILLAGGATAVFGWRLAAVLTGLLAAAFIVQLGAQVALRRADRDRHAAERVAADASLELVEHLELLRSGAGVAGALARFDAGWSRQARAAGRTSRAASLATVASAIAQALPAAGMVLTIALSGAFTSTETLAVLLMTLAATAPLEGVALASLSAGDLRATVTDFTTVANAPALPEPSAPREVPEAGALALGHLHAAPALHGISATIAEGSRTVIVGATGTGKSTLLELIMRFADPDAGEVRYGATPVSEFATSDYQERFAYVPQVPVVFAGTLAENIRLGAPNASDAEVRDAAEAAQLARVIARSPEGLEQQIGHRGGRLSGGERQRVAIARALVRSAPILVLDEATSALDADTERRVAASIVDIASTVIVVTHGDPSLWRPTQEIVLTR